MVLVITISLSNETKIIYELNNSVYTYRSISANRAVRIIGLLLSEFPEFAQDEIVIPMFLEEMEKGMTKDIITWPTCDPIERVSVIDSNPGLTCVDAIYYSFLAQYLLECGL